MRSSNTNEQFQVAKLDSLFSLFHQCYFGVSLKKKQKTTFRACDGAGKGKS